MTVLVLPSAGHPVNGDDLDADIIRTQIVALLGFLQSLDLSNAQAGTLGQIAFDNNTSPTLARQDFMPSFISGGGLPAGFTGLSLTIPAIASAFFKSTGGRLQSLSGGTYSVAINNDTYFSLNANGAIDVPQAVSNNASAPSLPAGSQWLFYAISGASAITSIVDLRTLSPFNRTAGVDGATLNPIPGGNIWTDVPSSSVKFYVPVASLLTVTLGGYLQVNINDTAIIQLNLDGALVGRQARLHNPTSSTFIADVAKPSQIPLSAGWHTMKVQGSCATNANCAASDVGWRGVITLQ